ncbi:hypothetical protein PABG_05214 [Paracoccidioides brasiliensis Pb03]|nr:hypothetical protein PABG_05214 [Paracoccidioides brasiliensis Pb03]
MHMLQSGGAWQQRRADIRPTAIIPRGHLRTGVCLCSKAPGAPQRFLDRCHGYIINKEVAIVVAEKGGGGGGGKDKRFGEPGMKGPRWTREDDAHLKDLKRRGWHWWETKQQFPERTKSDLQQR